MARVDFLLVNAGELATLAGPARARRGKELADLGVVRNGAVAVRDGRIVAVGPTRRLASRFEALTTLDAEGRFVAPGLVDAHTHLPFAGSRAFELDLKLSGRSYLEILREGGGIHRTVRDTRRAKLPDLVAMVRRRLEVMLRWGTTTAEAKSGYGLSHAHEVKQLRALRAAAHDVDLVPTYLGAHVVPQERERDPERYVREMVERTIPFVAREGLAEFVDAFLEANAFGRRACRDVLEAGRAHGLRTKLHADEFTNQRGAELAAQLECTSAEHLLKISARGVRALAKSQTVAVMLPGVPVTSFLDEWAPARRLIDGGAAVALGTDFNPNCHVLTMPTVMQWACYHMRMRPAEALAAATINAAHAVGRGDSTGSLEVGKRGDLVVFDRRDVTDLMYLVGPNPVWRTVVGGRVVAGGS